MSCVGSKIERNVFHRYAGSLTQGRIGSSHRLGLSLEFAGVLIANTVAAHVYVQRRMLSDSPALYYALNDRVSDFKFFVFNFNHIDCFQATQFKYMGIFEATPLWHAACTPK